MWSSYIWIFSHDSMGVDIKVKFEPNYNIRMNKYEWSFRCFSHFVAWIVAPFVWLLHDFLMHLIFQTEYTERHLRPFHSTIFNVS